MSLTDKLFKTGGRLFECGRTAALEAARRGYSRIKEIKENGMVNTVKSKAHHELNRFKNGGEELIIKTPDKICSTIADIAQNLTRTHINGG